MQEMRPSCEGRAAEHVSNVKKHGTRKKPTSDTKTLWVKTFRCFECGKSSHKMPKCRQCSQALKKIRFAIDRSGKTEVKLDLCGGYWWLFANKIPVVPASNLSSRNLYSRLHVFFFLRLFVSYYNIAFFRHGSSRNRLV